MTGKVWLIGGTSDSAAIAKILVSNNIPLIISVTTPTARSLYDRDLEIVTGCMDLGKMQSFCQQKNIKAVVDASHPYAVEVSTQAIAVTAKFNIPYLRYERSNLQENNSTIADSLITELDSFETLLLGDYLQEQTVLLAIGCKTLPRFKSWQDRATLYARILPKIESIAIAQSGGFKSDRIIAIRPPLSMALEKALWQQWNISLAVAKASGTAGGEDIKRQVAIDLNVPLIIIARPKIVYPQQTKNFRAILAFCQ